MERADAGYVTSSEKIRVFYDDQCEVCQACVSWLRLLDRKDRTECIGIHPETLQPYSALTIDGCLQQLHVIDSDGQIVAGWTAVARLARLSPYTWLIGALGAIPPGSWFGRLLYGSVARNRYSLSKCRGGACHTSKITDVRSRASLTPFWTCYSLGFLLRFPLSVMSLARAFGRNARLLWRTHGRRIDLPGGKLSLVFLNSWTCDLVSLLFGEQFLMVLYDRVAIDPGSTRMRATLARQVDRLPVGAIQSVAATHHHEEHSCNLNWLGARMNVPVYVGAGTARILQSPPQLPAVRRWMIGQPPPLRRPFVILREALPSASGTLEVIPAPGHCDDHVVFYDRAGKLLLAGDTFMGIYFSAPNPDVDSLKWITTLRRLADLEIETLVEGHGFVHTLRADVPDLSGLVVRRDPREQILEKLRFFEWLREQIQSGIREGLPLRAVEASCFPWGRAFGWEQFASDEMARLLSAGHWSRTELVRSFLRFPDDKILPTLYQASFWYGDGGER